MMLIISYNQAPKNLHAKYLILNVKGKIFIDLLIQKIYNHVYAVQRLNKINKKKLITVILRCVSNEIINFLIEI